jgi:hypothetical protein
MSIVFSTLDLYFMIKLEYKTNDWNLIKTLNEKIMVLKYGTTVQILKKISPSFFRHCVVPKDLFGWWSVGLGVFFLLDSHQYMHNVSFSNFSVWFIIQIILPEKGEKTLNSG